MNQRRPARESRDTTSSGGRRAARGTRTSSTSRTQRSVGPKGGSRAKKSAGGNTAPKRASAKPTQPAAGSSADSGADGAVRLNKLLATHGVASRRRADEMIAEGAVMIDGEIVTDLGIKVDPSVQRVEVDGVVIDANRVRHRYYLLNKPSGVVCTSSNRELRPRAIDLVTDRDKGRIFTVGRLDEDTTGLLILTNDGDFANRVMHPRYGVDKTYRAKVAGRIDDAALQKIREGVHLADGRTGGARVVVMKRSTTYSTLLVTIQEGKNREVRRVFARTGHKVVDLKRVRIGHISDRGLKVGSWRPLRRFEIEELLAGPTAEQEREERADRGERGARRGSGGRGANRGGGKGAGSRSTRTGGKPATKQRPVPARRRRDDDDGPRPTRRVLG